jgi:hypothetical protein
MPFSAVKSITSLAKNMAVKPRPKTWRLPVRFAIGRKAATWARLSQLQVSSDDFSILAAIFGPNISSKDFQCWGNWLLGLFGGLYEAVLG